nr:hypothetical protein [uncultured Carboxylicivirga sp.]
MILSVLQLDFIKEIINIGVGNGADVLNRLVREPIEIKTIDLSIFEASKIENKIIINEDTSSVVMDFSGPITGRSSLLFPSDSAVDLVHVISPRLSTMKDFSHLKMNVLMEVGNIVINGVIGSIANSFKLHLNYSVPIYEQGKVNSWHSTLRSDYVIIANTQLKVQNKKIQCNILIGLEVNSITKLIDLINKALLK